MASFSALGGWGNVNFDVRNSYKFFVSVTTITKHPNTFCMKSCHWYSLIYHKHIWMDWVNMSQNSTLTLVYVRITQRDNWNPDSWTPNQKDFDSVGLRWGPRIYFYWKPLDYADMPIHIYKLWHRLFKFGDKIWDDLSFSNTYYLFS